MCSHSQKVAPVPVKTPIRCTAFEGTRRIAAGELPEVAIETKAVLDRGERAPVLIFDDTTSEQIEVDFRGTTADVLRRLADRSKEKTPAVGHEPNPVEAPASPRGPGRPRLGVVAREVTLLPRHWEWPGPPPAGGGWGWSRGRPRSGRGTGNGSAASPAAPRSRCASWSRTPAAPASRPTAAARRRKRRIASSPPWPATFRASKKQTAPSS